MAQVYSARLVTAHAIDTYDFTVEDGADWVVRTITCFWPGPDAVVNAQLVDVAYNATLWWVHDNAVLPGAYQSLNDVRIVLPAGTSYQLLGLASPDVSLNGYRLILP